MMKRQKRMTRGAGVLLPVASLPSPYGIGTFGQAAYELVDFLAAAGQRYWQVLPLGPTSYGDSPYQSFSAFGGNPYFIDLPTLVAAGLLTRAEVEAHPWGEDSAQVDYGTLYRERFQVLRLAASRSSRGGRADYGAFCEKNAHWLPDYALFMAIKGSQAQKGRDKGWQSWEEPLRMREPTALAEAARALSSELDFWCFCQFEFFTQWEALKRYANGKGIQIIGDIPIYAAMDSADVWAHSDLFQLDEARRPTAVAGVPPDLFSTTGQLWGNPLYDWAAMEGEGFAWWRARMAASARLYDVIRIDHFIGVVNYYAIPAQDTTAKNGWWEPGPGAKLLEAVTPMLGNARLIAEDLGVLTPPVVKLRERWGYPGMRLLQFAFDGDSDSDFLPCHFDKNTVVYGGTHDNETMSGYFSRCKRKTLRFARAYLGVKQNRDIPAALIRAGYASSADTAIFQLQDLMGLGNEARINTPSTLGGNWCWRLQPGQLNPELGGRLLAEAKLYGRYTEEKHGKV